jgi:hypothetical protein
MKKIIAAATGLMMVGGVMATTVPAVENEFGGYWRTRMVTQDDMVGEATRADTRTRLYYTAVFNENFKFVNKFEFNAVFGDTNGGDIGADGDTFRVKNSYADFKLGNAQFKVGIQGATLARGFLFADDFSGVVAIFNAGDTALPFAWIKPQDDAFYAFERDYYATFPIIKVSDSLTLNPYFVYDKGEGIDHNNYYAGMDIDMKMDAFSFWGTGIYQFGEILGGQDISAFLVAAGGSAGPVHGQVFYATGDDDPTDGDRDDFVNPQGRSYYWSEIMGLGIFDNARSNGSPGDGITNIMAANVGFKVKPADKLTVGADLWYAALAEDNAAGDSELGFEVDVVVTYALMDNLKLDLVGAYLFAGDATGDEDPVEVGARLSLSF